jgi:hypothetical protein
MGQSLFVIVSIPENVWQAVSIGADRQVPTQPSTASPFTSTGYAAAFARAAKPARWSPEPNLAGYRAAMVLPGIAFAGQILSWQLSHSVVKKCLTRVESFGKKQTATKLR